VTKKGFQFNSRVTGTVHDTCISCITDVPFNPLQFPCDLIQCKQEY